MGAPLALQHKASAGRINRRRAEARQQKEIVLEEEQRTRMYAEPVNQRTLKRREGFGPYVIQVNPLLRSERDVSCCVCPSGRGVSTASRAMLLMIHIPRELPMSLEVMMAYLRSLLITASSNWKTLNLGPCLC